MGNLILNFIEQGFSLVYMFIDMLLGLADTKAGGSWLGVVYESLADVPAYIRESLKDVHTRPHLKRYKEVMRRFATVGDKFVYFAPNPEAFAKTWGGEVKRFRCINVEGMNTFVPAAPTHPLSSKPVPYQAMEVKHSSWFTTDGKMKGLLMYKAFLPLDGRARTNVKVEDILGDDYVYVVKEKKEDYLDINVTTVLWDDLKKIGFKLNKKVKKITTRIFRHTCRPLIQRNMIEGGGYIEPQDVGIASHIHLDGCALMTTKLANKLCKSGNRIQKGDTAMGQLMMSTFHKVMFIFVDKIHGHNCDVLLFGRHFVGKAHVQPDNKGVSVSFWHHGHEFAATVNQGMSSIMEGVGKAILQDLKKITADLLANPAQMIEKDPRKSLIDKAKEFGVNSEFIKLFTMLRAKGNLLSRFKGLQNVKKYSWRLTGSGSAHIVPYDEGTMMGLISAKAARWLKSFEGKSFKELGYVPTVICSNGKLALTLPEFADKVWYWRFDTADFDDTVHYAKVGDMCERTFMGLGWRFPIRGNGAVWSRIWDDNPKREWITYNLDPIWGKYSKDEDPWEIAPETGNVVLTDPVAMQEAEAKFMADYRKYKEEASIEVDVLKEALTFLDEDEDFSYGSWFLVHLACRILRNYVNKNGLKLGPKAKALVEKFAKLSPSDILDWSLKAFAGLFPKGVLTPKEEEKLEKEIKAGIKTERQVYAIIRGQIVTDMKTFKLKVKNGDIKVPRSMAGNPKPLGLWEIGKKALEKSIETRTFEDEFYVDNILVQAEVESFKAMVNAQLFDMITTCRKIIFPHGCSKTDVHNAAWRLIKRCGLLQGQINGVGDEGVAEKLGLSPIEMETYYANRRRTIRALSDQLLEDVWPKRGSVANRRRYAETLGYHLFEYMLYEGREKTKLGTPRGSQYFTYDKWFDILVLGTMRNHAGTLGHLGFEWVTTERDPKWYNRAMSDLVDHPDAAWNEVAYEDFSDDGTDRSFLELRWCYRLAGKHEDGTPMSRDEIKAVNKRIYHKGNRDWEQIQSNIDPQIMFEVSEFVDKWYEDELEGGDA